MSYDLVCKYLAEEYPATFVQWLLGIETQGIQILKTELNVKPIQADSLLFLKVGQQILHFAPLTKTNIPENLLAQVAREINKIEDGEAQKTLTTCTSLLAGLRLNKDLVNSIFREDIMKESVIYQDIIQKGREQGIKEGELRFVIRLLKCKFGRPVPTQKREKLETLTTEELEDLGEAILNFSKMEDLDDWLENLD